MNNLVTRTISGIIFLVIMVAGIWFSEYSYAALFLFIMLSTMLEFHRMTIAPGRHIWARVLTLVSAVTLFSTIFLWQRFGISPRFILLSLIPVLLASGGSIFEKVKDDYITVAYAYTSFVYIALPLSIASLAVFRDGVYDGPLLLCFFGIIWGSDVGAYCLGCTLGRNSRKMCPKISPKKSWWGFAGGLITAVAISLGLKFFGVFSFSLLHSIILGLLLNLVSVLGDLVESVWKRYYDLKDSGRIMPGHGGMLDRFDSSLFAIPVGTIYMLIFNLI